MAIHFVADSMTDFNTDIIGQYPLDILPLSITMGGKTYYDRIDISPEMVVDFVENHDDEFPKTSQVHPMTYQEHFERILQEGKDLIYLALSSGLSGGFQSATMIAAELQEKYPERRIAVVDSCCATTGSLMILHQGIKLARLNRSFDEIVETMTFLAHHIQIFFMVGDIKWLGKGGRISKSAALIGDMLKIVPILYIGDSTIVVADKVRGRKKAFKRMFELMEEKNPNYAGQIFGLASFELKEYEDKAAKILFKDYGVKNFIIPNQPISSALISHLGKNSMGFMFFDELPDNYVNVL